MAATKTNKIKELNYLLTGKKSAEPVYKVYSDTKQGLDERPLWKGKRPSVQYQDNGKWVSEAQLTQKYGEGLTIIRIIHE